MRNFGALKLLQKFAPTMVVA